MKWNAGNECEWVEMNELKLMNWNELLEINDLPKVVRNPQFFLRFFMWNRALTTVSCTFCRPHLPQVLRSPQIFTVLCDQLMMWMTYEIELSLQSRAPFVDLIFQKCSEPLSFLTCPSGNRSLATVSCTFCRLHLPKVLRTRRLFLMIFMWNRALATVLCAFCRPHLPKVFWQFFTIFTWNRALATVPCTFSRLLPRSSRETRETETLLRRPRQPLYPKKTGLRARQCFQTWIHAFPISHTSQLVAWWCGCHDDWDDDVVAIMVRKLAMTIVRNSEVS